MVFVPTDNMACPLLSPETLFVSDQRDRDAGIDVRKAIKRLGIFDIVTKEVYLVSCGLSYNYMNL